MIRRLTLLFILGLAGTSLVLAEPVVVVSARSGVQNLSQDDVINIFLGRYRRLSNGLSADPVDLPADSGIRADFYRRLVNKDLAEINAYWSRLVFSGKTTPPKQATSIAEAAKFIAGNSGAIGYLERGQVDGRFRIVLEFSP